MAGGVRDHYDGEDLAERFLAELGEVDGLTAAKLSQVDQMHLRGLAATRELHALLAPGRDDHVLDIGCGIAGPARVLASGAGCTVTGLDLTPAYCACARELNQMVGLDDVIEIVEGDATDLPFDDESFDAVVTQHACMNVEDKAAVYAEVARVLVPGGRFALYDVMAGEGPAHYPVPWAGVPEISFLVPPGEVRRLVEAAGLTCRHWEDQTDKAVAFVETQRQERAARAASGQPESPSAANVFMGANAAEKQRNFRLNLAEGRVRVVMALFEKA